MQQYFIFIDVCSAGYQHFMNTNTCIKLERAGKEWDDARQICEKQPGGDLVSITTKEK